MSRAASGGVSAGALVRTVAGREISVKLHDKGFLASTVVFVLVIVAAVVLPALLDGGKPSYTVAATEDARPVAMAAAALGAAEPPPAGVSPMSVTSVDASGDPAAVLEDPGIDVVMSIDGDAVVLTGRTGVPDDLRTLVTAASSSLAAQAVAAEAGLTPEQVAALTTPQEPSVVLTDPRPVQPVPPELLGVIFGFLFYFTVLTFGVSIAQSVVEEKQSRVVEILVAALPVRWLLAGKVAGATVMAFGQVLLIVGAGLVGAQVTGASDVVAQAIGVSGWFLAFFVLGFLMLACLWAVAGSLASRIEDLQSTTLYMQLAVMIPFFASVFVRDEGPARIALSYFPLSAPLVMPARLATGDAAAWEPWAAMAIVAVTAAVFVAIGARLYAGSVLNTSSRTRIGGAWAAGAGR